jgi:hypothetical protein
MATEAVTSGLVHRGRLKLRATPAFQHQLQSFRDGPVTITIERKRATRSSQSNRLYWGVYVKALSDHTGYTPDEIHEILKAKFLPKKLAICDGNGEVVDEYVVGGSTTKLDVIEFGDYLNAIHEWAVSLRCPLPELDEGVA